MKKTIILFALLLTCAWFTSIQAQQYYCEDSAGDLYAVSAPSGLSLRAAPSLLSSKILAVPFGKLVTVCSEFRTNAEEISGTEGQWVKAFYQGKEGYMFDGYLDAKPNIEVIYSQYMLPENYALDKEYYGLYPQKEHGMITGFKAEKYVLPIAPSPIDGMEVKSVPTPSEVDQPLFLFAGLEPGQLDNIVGRQLNSQFLYPGQSVFLETEKAAYYVYAKGRIVSNSDENNPNPFSKIRNYELRVKKITGEDIDDQSLYKLDIPAWYGEGYDGGVQLQWIGDLDGDGELDMLLTTATQDHCWEVIFLLSSKAEPGHLFRQVSRYTDCCC
ncbi:MAG: SH3 domain-containing protein [Bacteroidota bacterium]